MKQIRNVFPVTLRLGLEINSWAEKINFIVNSQIVSIYGHYFFISWFTDFSAGKTGRSVGKKKKKIPNN